ncbi:MAG TPA: hypothetical protein VE733_16355 [Streptosporangiaceae bacterium]|nr:hypothetical protein [Streptosporangiaceae bacterium]
MRLGRLDDPAVSAQLQAIEPAAVPGGRESRRAAPEEVRCLLQASEQRAPLKPLCHPDIDADVGGAISAGERHMEVPLGLADIEGRVVVLAGEQTPAREDRGH